MKHFLVPENVFAALHQNLCSQRYDVVEPLVTELRKCKAVQLNEPEVAKPKKSKRVEAQPLDA